MNPINPINQLEHHRPVVKAWGYVPPLPPPPSKTKKLFDEITDYLAREQARERDRPKRMQRKETTVVTIKDISNGEL